VSRLPIRGRLTVAFAAAMFVVLAVTGLFVYLRLQADLDESLTASLQARADAVAELASRSAAPLTSATPGVLGEPDESFAAVLSPAGRLTDASGGARGPLLGAADLRRARQQTVLVERRVAGIDSEARALARRASARADSPLVVVGQSLEDRDETLDGSSQRLRWADRWRSRWPPCSGTHWPPLGCVPSRPCAAAPPRSP